MINKKIKQLLELFADPSNTQLMKQPINLYALKYLKIQDLLLVHSFYHKTQDRSENILFAAPVLAHKIHKSVDNVELTIRALKDEYTERAISLVRALDKREVEVAYSHLHPSIVSPKLQKDGWDNWVFSYNASFEEKLKRRQQKNIKKANDLYRNFTNGDFNNKKVLFLGCGDGDEITAFLSYFELEECSILGIDQSAAAIEHCKKVRPPSERVTLNFIRRDISDLHNLTDKQFDYIFAIGLFDRETLSFTEGQSVIKKIKESIQFHTLVTSAYAFELFSAEDYTTLGFDVVATCEPQTLYTQHASFFYILRNTPRIAAIGEDVVAQESLRFFK
jgi:hypothetical protein